MGSSKAGIDKVIVGVGGWGRVRRLQVWFPKLIGGVGGGGWGGGNKVPGLVATGGRLSA